MFFGFGFCTTPGPFVGQPLMMLPSGPTIHLIPTQSLVPSTMVAPSRPGFLDSFRLTDGTCGGKPRTSSLGGPDSIQARPLSSAARLVFAFTHRISCLQFGRHHQVRYTTGARPKRLANRSLPPKFLRNYPCPFET